MEYKPETKICQNCKKDFTIEPDDFSFYEKIKVPPPTWCPECQLIRKFIFRNENNLYYHINDALSSKNEKIISIYCDKNKKVYDQKSWWGDDWDAREYAKDYDFTKSFFDQMGELIKNVPFPNLTNWNSVDNNYCNYTTDNKNCYLVFGGDFNENCSYSKYNFYSKNSLDLLWSNKCDLCYECIDVDSSYKLFFSQNSKNCSDSMFLYDCNNCFNCIGCVCLRNKSFCIFNEQYSKEDYEKIFNSLNLSSINGIYKFSSEFFNFRIKFPHKYANVIGSLNCTGDNILFSKNCINCFSADNQCENLKNSVILGFGAKDGINMSHFGHNSELAYDSLGVFSGSKNVLFSLFQPSSIDITYSYNCPSSSNLFGCVGIKKGQYMILNKQYTKEEYEELVPKIIKHMNDMPYIDSKGRIYKYGEFFPSELSPFCYNETIAQEYYPLTKDEALNQGYRWKDKEERNYDIDIYNKDISDDINDINEDIIGKVIECNHKDCNHQCTEAYKIIPEEYQFYKRMNLPLPRLCPNCRHYERLSQRNPLKLWHRHCMKPGCTNEFETSYSPDRPEIIYCEKCYQQEVY